MIRLATALARIGLVVAALAASVPMIAFAQANEPAIESVPREAEAEEVNASPTGDDMSEATEPPARLVIPAEVEIEFQRLFTELRSDLLDDRAATVDWWLAALAVVLGFFAIVAVVGGYIAFTRFREIEVAAKSSVATVTEIAETSKRHLKEIESNREKSDEILRGMNAETAADNPEEADQAIESVRENPEASPIQKAIALAVSLQQQGKRDEAIEKWRALAHITEGSDNDFAAGSWLSVSYLAMDKDPKGSVLANDEAIRLKPGYAEAYINRGNAKAALERYEAAIADYDEAIRLNPNLVKAYSNRGAAKRELGQYEAAVADCNEAIRLKPDYAGAYINRGNAKHKLGQYAAAIADYDEAIRADPKLAEAYLNRGEATAELKLKDEAWKDFEIALKLARNSNNSKIVAQAEQALRGLNDAEDS